VTFHKGDPDVYTTNEETIPAQSIAIFQAPADPDLGSANGWVEVSSDGPVLPWGTSAMAAVKMGSARRRFAAPRSTRDAALPARHAAQKTVSRRRDATCSAGGARRLRNARFSRAVSRELGIKFKLDG
jgi:hypothetical protein